MPALPLRMRSPRILPRPESCLIFEPRTSRNLGEIGMNLAEVSDSKTLKSEHWRGFSATSVVGLLIRRSLVRAQVGEPIPGAMNHSTLAANETLRVVVHPYLCRSNFDLLDD